MTVLRSLESIRSKFFNGNEINNKKASWVKWSNVLTAKEKGGLGVASLYALNRGLMCKWVWRLYANRNSLWSRVIKAIHGSNRNLGKQLKKGVRTVWTTIVQEVARLQQQGINIFDYIRLKLGNGDNILFWEDRWCDGMVLKDMFPRMYALETVKNFTVSMKLSGNSITNSFRRNVRSGIEESQLGDLGEMISAAALVPMADRYVWSLENSEVFSVASIRKLIDDKRFPDVNLVTRWIKTVPIKVNILTWKIKMDALPTRFNISRRGIEIDTISCPVCNDGVESTSHIFFQCSLVRQIARKICSWWNVTYAEVHTYEEWRTWVISLRIQVKIKTMFEGVFFGLWWSIWNYRNKLVFEGEAPKKEMIFDKLVSHSFYWCTFRSKAAFTWNDWLKNPYLVIV